MENELHRVRDMTFDEDRSQTRTATGPRIMASLRNLVITIPRLSGAPASPPHGATTHGIQPPTSNDHEVPTTLSRPWGWTWEPVSGFEPLTCRLQDGCSAD
jgi:hypothetical protein